MLRTVNIHIAWDVVGKNKVNSLSINKGWEFKNKMLPTFKISKASQISRKNYAM